MFFLFSGRNGNQKSVAQLQKKRDKD
uniref:Uncharacterized protein n=1 Tax=Anguilla anguilla TaxID=7936 RepID=A0A0E9SGM1_ANGAN